MKSKAKKRGVASKVRDYLRSIKGDYIRSVEKHFFIAPLNNQNDTERKKWAKSLLSHK